MVQSSEDGGGSGGWPADGGGRGGEYRSPGESLQMPGGFGEDAAAIREGAVDDVVAAFEDNDFFAVDEGEHGVGRGLGVFDEVAVDDQRIAVEAGEMDHGGASLRFFAGLIGEKGKKMKGEDGRTSSRGLRVGAGAQAGGQRREGG